MGNGASHQIRASSPRCREGLSAAEGVGRGGDADAGQGDRARLGHDHDKKRCQPPNLGNLRAYPDLVAGTVFPDVNLGLK